MSSTHPFIGLLLLIGPVVLVACILIGVFRYSPERATAIREGEADTPPVIVEQIKAIRISRPEKFHHDRLDRHPSYIGLHIATQCYGWCVVGGAQTTSNLATLSEGSKFAMAACFLIGSSLVLAGASMGLRCGRWTFLRGIRDNIASARLGDDIRLPYGFAAIGMCAIAVSMGIYGSTSFTSTTGSLGGWITSVMAVVSVLLCGQFVHRIRTYEKVRAAVISDAVARLELGGDVLD